MPYDDDDITTDSNTVATRAVVTLEGTCAKHPHVKLRGRNSAGQLFQRDSCYECDAEFQNERKKFLQKQQELDRQIQSLDNNNNNNNNNNTTEHNFRNMDISNAINPNSNSNAATNSSHHRGMSLDELSTNTSNAPGSLTVSNGGGGYPGSGGYPPYGGYAPYGYPPPHPYGYHPPPPPQGQNGKPGGPPMSHPQHHPGWGPPPPHMAPMVQPPQQSQDDSKLFALLTQKEDELKELRSKYEESQGRLQNQTVELSRLQAKLEAATANLEQERKIARLESEAAAKEKLEALVQEQRREHKETMKQMQEQMSQAAAAIALARNEAPPPPVLSQSHPSLIANRQVSETEHPDNGGSGGGSVGISRDGNMNGGKNDQNSSQGSDPYYENDGNAKSSLISDENNKLPVDKFEKGSRLPITFDDSTMGSSVVGSTGPSPIGAISTAALQDYSFVDDDDDDQNEKQAEEEKFNTNNIKATSAPAAKLKPWQQNYQDDANQSVMDEVSMGAGSSTMEALAKATAKKPANKDKTSHFVPKYSDPNERQPIVEEDNQSLGQTVASSTYGEDRQKVVNKTLLDPYGDRGIYTGVILRTTGMPHGLGRMVYEEDGRVFEGDWRHGRWHGYGRASFSNGDSYEGEYKFDQRHGRGVYSWNDGRVYDGQFSEDKRHGKGLFTWPDGAVYEGEFVNGQRQGHGKYKFADGGQYEGSWQGGRYSGFGTCTWEDGRKYRGEWRNGMAHGRGTETYPNGAIRHEGQWIDDEPVR